MRSLASLAVVLCAAFPAAHAVPAASLGASEQVFDARIEELRDSLIEFRRDLHRHPEVSGEEERTARVVADRLEALGLSVRRSVGGHGVVALLRGAQPGPTVAFRADMDAVFSNDPDPVPFASVRPGVRHICGHDIHTTIGVALAEGFVAARESLAGSVLLVFQPAEERATGAEDMLADGVFHSVKPDAIFAYHATPFETGAVALADGVMMSGRDRVRITVRRQGSEDDLAEEAQRLIDQLTTIDNPLASQPRGSDFIFARSGRPQSTGDGAMEVFGTITTASAAASDAARSRLRDWAEGVETREPGADVQVDYQERWVPGVVNDPALAVSAAASAERVLGDANVAWLQTVSPAFSEDFGSFQREVPGVMFFLGVSNTEKGWVGMPHSPEFVADEESIFVGARTMAAVILDRLSSSS